MPQAGQRTTRTDSSEGFQTMIFASRSETTASTSLSSLQDEDAANGGALLARLLGHLGDEALDEDGELRIVRGDVLPG